MNTEHKLLVIDALRIVESGGLPAGWMQVVGLCSNIRGLIGGADIDDWLRCTCAEWPEYSGHPFYPVPHPDALGSGAAARAYEVYTSLYSGPYGAARRRLAGYIADRLEALL